MYAAIRPDGTEPAWPAPIPELRPTLRPYQSRALAWMVRRERGAQVPYTLPQTLPDCHFTTCCDVVADGTGTAAFAAARPAWQDSSGSCSMAFKPTHHLVAIMRWAGQAGGFGSLPAAPAVAGGAEQPWRLLSAAGVRPGQPAALPAAAADCRRHAGRRNGEPLFLFGLRNSTCGLLAECCSVSWAQHATRRCIIATGPGQDGGAAGAGVGQPLSRHLQGSTCKSAVHNTLPHINPAVVAHKPNPINQIQHLLCHPATLLDLWHSSWTGYVCCLPPLSAFLSNEQSGASSSDAARSRRRRPSCGGSAWTACAARSARPSTRGCGSSAMRAPPGSMPRAWACPGPLQVTLCAAVLEGSMRGCGQGDLMLHGRPSVQDRQQLYQSGAYCLPDVLAGWNLAAGQQQCFERLTNQRHLLLLLNVSCDAAK